MVTIQDVARKAGVNVNTATRALNGKTQGKRADALARAEKVLKVANELGYVPSSLAQSLRSGKTKTIGMLSGEFSNYYFGKMADEVCRQANQKGYKLLLELTVWDKQKEEDAIKDLYQRRVDGIIAICDIFDTEKKFLYQLKKQNFPLVTIKDNKYGFCPVKVNYQPSFEKLVKYYKSRGHKKNCYAFSQ